MKSRAIRRILVRHLFGTYDYDLAPSDKSENPDRLIILYGDNGSGKTTILRILFHLLAPELGQGHKTALAAIPFSRFEVRLTSGQHLWVQRPEGRLTGAFTIGLRHRGRKEHTAEFRQSERGGIKASPTTDAFLQKLSKLDVGLYFLSDDRTVRLAGLQGPESAFANAQILEEEMIFYSDLPPHVLRHRTPIEPQERAQQLLAQSLRRAEQWIQSQAVRSSSRGESSVNTLYAEILKRIARLPLNSTGPESTAVQALERRIAKLEDRSREYSRYGLQPKFNGKDILRVVKGAPASHVTVVTTVVTPYVESVEKKLDAMERLQRQVHSLVQLVNSFYTGKQLHYEIHDGFRISTDDGKPLQPQMLSSGERHLLLLFCNTVQALERPSIFIIDEPEISLNIKWQRRLLSALLECAGDNPVQYLFATHSFELLGRYRNNVIKLEHTLEQSDGPKANA
jgi:energy-coupling factor transporter ATP-binding protein EcfA2